MVVSKEFQGSFKQVKNVLKVFRGSFKLQEDLKDFQQGCLGEFQGYFKGSSRVVSRTFQRCFKLFSRIFHGKIKEV